MSVTSREVKENDARREERARSLEMKPDFQNDDGSVTDTAAQAFLERQLRHSATAPNDRRTDDHTVGTAQWREENSPDNMHSDGGSTLAYDDPDAKDYDEELGVKDKIAKIEADRNKKDKSAKK